MILKGKPWIFSGAGQMWCWHWPREEGLLEINCRLWNPVLLPQLTLQRPRQLAPDYTSLKGWWSQDSLGAVACRAVPRGQWARCVK